MKKERVPGSLREKLAGIMLICWLLPIMIIVTTAGVLLRLNFERNLSTQLETDAVHALQLVEGNLNDVVDASKRVSYDGVVRSAYREYQQSGDSAALYRSVNEYLNQTFSRDEVYQAVFISFWNDIRIYPYVMGSGIQGYSIPRNYHRRVEPVILEEMKDADTAIRFLEYDGELYVARNLLDSRFEPYASIVMLCDRGELYRPLDDIRRISGVSLLLDDLILDDEGMLRSAHEEEKSPQELSFEGNLEGHMLCLTTEIESYSIMRDMPELRIAVAVVILLVVPLLLVMIALFRRQVTKPVETLLSATDRVQNGERGYQIEEEAGNEEFERMFRHFNIMSSELENQFERSRLEQQTLQQAQIKALQSQINPHFLNNTLEIINWEARLAGDERVSAMIEALSVMLDAALDRDGRGEILLREELSYVDAYLYIIRERLGEKLVITREIDETLTEAPVPRLILQPLVENAVEHDLAPQGGGGLCLRVYREGDRIVLESEHDGTMTEEDLATVQGMLSDTTINAGPVSGQVGLRNVRQRLQLLYGDQGTITVEQCSPGRILARASLPLHEAAK